MIKIATQEGKASDLAPMQVLMGLTLIHTFKMSAGHLLYDLTVRPKYPKLHRDEISDVILEAIEEDSRGRHPLQNFAG